MFNWATSKLTALSETLAPPPSTPSHRFLSALSQNNEHLALQILNDPHEPFDCYTSLNNRGMSSIHIAASYGAGMVLREILGRGVRVDLTDYNGWTALHHASASSSSNALMIVKYLVEECGASILLKTNEGGTAYDVASSQSVRGYLLPRQLQLETKECLDNGGKGLMPGIDLGGCQVNYSHLAPPPVMGGPPAAMGAGPPSGPGAVSNSNNNYDPSAALMQPPPVRGIGASPRQPVPMSPSPMQSNVSSMSNNYSAEPLSNNGSESVMPTQQPWQSPAAAVEPTPAASSSQPQFATQNEQQQFQSPPVANEPPAPSALTQPVTQDQQQQPPPPTQTSSQPEPNIQQPPNPTQQAISTPQQPPRSNNSQTTASYALRGGNANTASILNESTITGRKIYKPDGFHSSSNDKDLQAKYGHVPNEFEVSRKAAVPPPPVSGGGAPIITTGSPAAPPSGGYNPYSARPSGGYIGGSGRMRYPAYCAVSDSVSAPPSLSGGGQYSGGGGGAAAGAVVPVYANFSQGGFGSQQSNVQQQQQNNGQQQQQTESYGAAQTTANAYGTAEYNQPMVQQQQWQGGVQNQSANAYQQYTTPVQHQHWQGDNMQQTQTAPAYNAASAQQQWAGEQQPNNYHGVQPQVDQTTAISPAKQENQPIMAADAAANMFGTPHADTPKESATTEVETLPSLPMDSSNANAQDLFSSPPMESTPAKSEVAADVFASPPSASQSNDTAQFTSPPVSTEQIATDNHVTQASDAVSNNDAGFFFGSPSSQSENNITNNPSEPPPAAGDASSFFSGEKDDDAGEQTAESPEKSSTNEVLATQPPIAAAPSAAPVRSFGGLPPPPVIGGTKPLTTPSSYVTSPAGTSLPPPPMASSSPSVMKDEDIAADQMADVSLS